MIEIRTFDGGPEDLARFCTPIWRRDLEGKELVPVWDASFFEWQLFAGRPATGPLYLAAYDGAQLAGVVLAEPFDFQVHHRGCRDTVTGSAGSWFTVDPAYRPLGVGIQLLQALRDAHRERDAAMCLGFIVGGSKAAANAFWSAYAGAFPGVVQHLGDVGLWVRLLDGRTAASWALTETERRLAQTVAWVTTTPKAPRPGENGLREYRAADLDACARLVSGFLDEVDLGTLWTRERLAVQLDYRGIPKTLVIERQGEVVGLVNWYVMGSIGRAIARIGMIDLLAVGRLSPSEARTLLQGALADMQVAGCTFAATLRLPYVPALPLVSSGFVPFPADTSVVAVKASSDVSLSEARRMHVHLR